MSRHIVIVGGGLAGLAAATALAGRAGLRVTLCESRPRWGGRASSFVDQLTGEPIDNCQHVALGCCTNFRHFCETLGIASHFCRERELVFIDRQGGHSRFAAAPLPAPLHLAPAFARLQSLSWSDKWRLALGLRALARTNPAEWSTRSFQDWLLAHRQPATAIENFWYVVLVSALSETLDRIDVGHARKVFVDGFLANRQGWEVWLPTVPLDDLYGGALADWFQTRQVDCRLQCGIKRVLETEPAAAGNSGAATATQAAGVELRTGERIDADQVILAVPQQLVLPLLPDKWQTTPELSAIRQLETAPISSVHLWFDRPITDLRHATLLGRTSQWLFNRSAIQGRSATMSSLPPSSATDIAGPSYYQVVISASRDVVEAGQEATIRTVMDELADIWPVVRSARLVHSRLVTEHKAVVSVQPGVDNLRPEQRSPIAGLHLAGDWTRTGWPGTMEGAVRSGYLAAESVLERLGMPARFVQPDLPVALLSKVLYGL